MNYLIGVDVGTSSTKAVLYDQNAQVITQANYGYELHRNAAGMAEQEPEEVINAAEQNVKSRIFGSCAYNAKYNAQNGGYHQGDTGKLQSGRQLFQHHLRRLLAIAQAGAKTSVSHVI